MLLSSLLVGGIALSVTSCADDDINSNQGDNGDALVRFSINDVQEQAVNRGLEMTRGALPTVYHCRPCRTQTRSNIAIET